MAQPQSTQNRIRINFQIKVPQVRVVLDDGTTQGVMTTSQALQMARDMGLDLVEINPKLSPPICKIIDYGKYKYDEKKRAAEIRKNQKVVEVKQITLTPNIDQNDLIHKISQAKEFLLDGNKVQVTVRFKGREITHAELGKEKLELIVKTLSEIPCIATPISLEGKRMSLTISAK
jgi:translation initiation factor IF-3